MTTISFKVSEPEAERIRMAAKREGVTVSEFLRRRAISGQTPRPVRKVRCPHTGAEIFDRLPEALPLTTRRVNALLSDFP